jgi:hypothetical protein
LPSIHDSQHCKKKKKRKEGEKKMFKIKKKKDSRVSDITKVSRQSSIWVIDIPEEEN